MKILAIRGRNLASLAGDFVVDFEQEPLKSAGLFAISGPTGAGKSTLLDALCMALYENTPRLLKAGGAKTLPDGSDFITHQDAANLLRRSSAEGHAEVDFIGNDGHSYRARWSVRRSRGKVGGSLQPTSMSLKLLPDLLPIGGTKNEVKAEIIKRIGLSFQQFTRAVLLAQNEFSSFLKSDDNERGELLETLTGSAIYSQLSMRAFARAKQEQQELQRIEGRLADQKPLSEPERVQLEQDCAAANASVATLDMRKAALETQLRWHQDDAKLSQAEAQAQTHYQQGLVEQAAADSRNAALQQVEAVQAARPLVAEVERLARSITQDHGAIADNSARLASAEQLRQQLDATLASAQTALHAAEQAQLAAAPVLDQAKALDASIATLLPAHQLTQQAQTTANANVAQAQALQSAKQQELAGAQQKQQATGQWLNQHAALQHLAEHWPAWDLLLKQASQSRNELATVENILVTYSQNAARQSEQAEASDKALASATASLVTAERQRQQASQHYTSIDIRHLPASKQQLDQRREQLASAEQLARVISEHSKRQQSLQTQAHNAGQVISTLEAAANQASARLPSLAAALTQAQRSLKSAEAACADNVETLRATLESDAPCPVCGATEHPYQASDQPQLHAMLASLQEQVSQCQQQQRQAEQQHSGNSAEAASQRRQLQSIHQELSELQQSLQAQQQTWQAHPIAIEISADINSEINSELNSELASLANSSNAELLANWFSRQRAALQTQLSSLEQSETASRTALQAREAAQAAYEQASIDQQSKKDAANSAQSQLQQTRAAQLAAQAQSQQHQHRLAASLDQLAPAFSATEEWQSDWRSHWQAAPEVFYTQCAHNVQQWQRFSKDQEQGQHRLSTLTQELNTLSLNVSQADTAQQRSAQELATSELTLHDKQAARLALFAGSAYGQGLSVKQIETQLADAIQQAKTGLVQHSIASNDSAQLQTRSAEALAQAKARLVSDEADANIATERLHAWLAQHRMSAEAPADMADHTADQTADQTLAIAATTSMTVARLHALLAHSAEWIASERDALQAIANATRQAATVWQERRTQRQAHQDQRPVLVLSQEIQEDKKQEAGEDVNTPSEDRASTTEDHHGELSESMSESMAASIIAPAIEPTLEAILALQQALGTLASQRQIAHASATQFHLASAQDQARRTAAFDIINAMETQDARYRIWETLNILIGAADGKKFRNYAQQYTLDVLLGYANRHLHELSRRYRLQRIPDTLALMVIDQDMGDEQRSVHSLSGGESFLVSLALALGLASLSSNRVKVESLFIDEGFGSLDADTLRVAMDALDGLQAMGRKVGVISHVQEMTERIAVKVLVQRGAGGRSLVGVG